MDKYSETFQSWDKVSELYFNKFMDFDLYNESYNQFCTLLNKPEADILDLGCGPGNISRYLIRKETKYKIVGLDVSDNMIKLARNKVPEATFKQFDLRNLKELTFSYDGIVAGFSLPYLSHADGTTMIAECARLLSEGGYFYISYVPGDPELSEFKTGSTGDRTFFYYYKKQSIENLLQGNSFKIISEYHYSYTVTDEDIENHHVLIAKKV